LNQQLDGLQGDAVDSLVQSYLLRVFVVVAEAGLGYKLDILHHPFLDEVLHQLLFEDGEG
jgi:hypothetical protein